MKSVLRENQRYIAIQVVAASSIDKPFLQSAVRNQLLAKLGEIGFAQADPKLVYVGRDMKTTIIRCLHTEADSVRAALSLVTAAGGKKIHLMPVFTSGTILKCKKELSKKR